MIGIIKWALFAIFIFFVFASDEKKKQNEYKFRFVHLALKHGNERVVNTLLDNFDKNEQEKFVEYLMEEEDQNKNTVLHHASQNGDEEIVELLVNAFGETKKKILIEFVMKENKKGKTAFMDAIVTPHSLDLYKKDQKGMQLKEELLTLLMSLFYIKEKKRQDYFTEIDENPMLMEPNRLMRKQDALKDIVFGPINQQCGEEKEKCV
jgi:hypothetical protein